MGPCPSEQLYSKCSTVIMTSATLSAGSAGFKHTQQRLRLDDAKTLQLGSPFSFREQPGFTSLDAIPRPAKEIQGSRARQIA